MINRRSSNGSEGGFGLLELIIVLSIITTLSAVAVPKYAASLARYRADAAAGRIKAELTTARRTARITGKSLTVNLPDYKDLISESPYRAVIVSADFDGNDKVIFDIYGAPDSGGTVVVQVGNVRRTVVLEAETGRAAVKD